MVGFSPRWSSGKPAQRQREVRGFSSILSELRAAGFFPLESLWNGAVREHKVLLQRLMGSIREQSV